MILFQRQCGEGTPLIILHGLFGQSDNWTSIARALAEQGLSVHCMDLRNHGMSPHSDRFSLRDMADDVAETLKSIGLDKVHLLGHSMGGKVAMDFALRYSEKLISLLLIDIGPQYYPPHHQDIIEGLLAIDPMKISSRKEAEEILSDYVANAAVRQFLLKNLHRNAEGEHFNWRFNLKVIASQISEVGKALPAGDVTLPALFLHGGKSNYIKVEAYPQIEEQFRNATFKVIPDAGHWLHAEQPAAFIEIVLNWVKAYH